MVANYALLLGIRQYVQFWVQGELTAILQCL